MLTHLVSRLSKVILLSGLAHQGTAHQAHRATNSAAIPEDAEFARWAGHQYVRGKKEVPVLGTLETRIDTYTIAEARRTPTGLVVSQRACAVVFEKVMGTTIRVNASALPKTKVHFTEVEPGAPFYTMRSDVRWGLEDIDGDGNPGMAIEIDAPMCGGTLHVSGATTTLGRARTKDADRPLEGLIDVWAAQNIVDADGKCLESLAKDSKDKTSGAFAFAPIDDDASCSSLMDEGWPVFAG